MASTPAIKDIEPNTYAFLHWSTLISDGCESELGLGNRCCDGCARTVTLLFPSTEKTACMRAVIPVTRVINSTLGDTITSHEGWQLHIDEVKRRNGLLVYVGTRPIPPKRPMRRCVVVLLDSKLVFSSPVIVWLFAGQIDRMVGSRCAIAPVNFKQSEQYRCHTAVCAVSGPI